MKVHNGFVFFIYQKRGCFSIGTRGTSLSVQAGFVIHTRGSIYPYLKIGDTIMDVWKLFWFEYRQQDPSEVVGNSFGFAGHIRDNLGICGPVHVLVN